MADDTDPLAAMQALAATAPPPATSASTPAQAGKSAPAGPDPLAAMNEIASRPPDAPKPVNTDPSQWDIAKSSGVTAAANALGTPTSIAVGGVNALHRAGRELWSDLTHPIDTFTGTIPGYDEDAAKRTFERHQEIARSPLINQASVPTSSAWLTHQASNAGLPTTENVKPDDPWQRAEQTVLSNALTFPGVGVAGRAVSGAGRAAGNELTQQAGKTIQGLAPGSLGQNFAIGAAAGAGEEAAANAWGEEHRPLGNFLGTMTGAGIGAGGGAAKNSLERVTGPIGQDALNAKAQQKAVEKIESVSHDPAAVWENTRKNIESQQQGELGPGSEYATLAETSAPVGTAKIDPGLGAFQNARVSYGTAGPKGEPSFGTMTREQVGARNTEFARAMEAGAEPNASPLDFGNTVRRRIAMIDQQQAEIAARNSASAQEALDALNLKPYEDTKQAAKAPVEDVYQQPQRDLAAAQGAYGGQEAMGPPETHRAFQTQMGEERMRDPVSAGLAMEKQKYRDLLEEIDPEGKAAVSTDPITQAVDQIKDQFRPIIFSGPENELYGTLNKYKDEVIPFHDLLNLRAETNARISEIINKNAPEAKRLQMFKEAIDDAMPRTADTGVLPAAPARSPTPIPETADIAAVNDPRLSQPGIAEASTDALPHRPLTSDFLTFAEDRPQGPASRDWLLDRGQETGNEHLTAYDPQSGQVTHAGTNDDPGYVTIPSDLAGTVDVHHNHTNGAPLSLEDHIAAVTDPRVNRVVAHTPDGGVYSSAGTPAATAWAARLGDDAQPALESIYKKAGKVVKQALIMQERGGHITDEEAWGLAHDLTSRALAAAGVIDYVSTHAPALPQSVVNSITKRASEAAYKEAMSHELVTYPTPYISNQYPQHIQFNEAMDRLFGEHGENSATTAADREGNQRGQTGIEGAGERNGPMVDEGREGQPTLRQPSREDLEPLTPGQWDKVRDWWSGYRQMAQDYWHYSGKQLHAVGKMLQPGGAYGEYKIPPEKVAGLITQDANSINTFLKVAGPDGPKAVEDALSFEMRAAAQKPNGELDTPKYNKWFENKKDALSAVPDLVDKFNTTAKAQNKLDQLNADLRNFTRENPLSPGWGEADILPKVFQKGQAGAAAMKQYLDLTGGSQKAIDAATDHAAFKFINDVAPDGKVNVTKAENWLRPNGYGPALDAVPGLREKFSTVADAQKTAEGALLDHAQLRAGYTKGMAQAVLSHDLNSLPSMIFSGKDRLRNAEHAMGLAAGDDAATEGLRRLSTEWIMKNYLGAAIPGSEYSGVRMQKFIDFARDNKDVLSTIFDKTTAKNYQLMADQMQRQQAVLASRPKAGSDTASIKAQATEHDFKDHQSFIKYLFSSVIGEQLAHNIGSGPLGHIGAAVGIPLFMKMFESRRDLLGAKSFQLVDEMMKDPALALNMKQIVEDAAKGRDGLMERYAKRLVQGAIQSARSEDLQSPAKRAEGGAIMAAHARQLLRRGGVVIDKATGGTVWLAA